MRAKSLARLARELSGDQLVLDVGGWFHPFARADWVIDLMPYETRGGDGLQGEPPERFTAATWVERDICDHEPWPFADDQFDFAVCGHTLEDVRDPVWVCSELVRVARAGYIEVPSRLEEQTYGVHGPWVGWSHHHWMIDVDDASIEFVFKHDVLHGPRRNRFPRWFYSTLSEDQKAQAFWWEGSFEFRERVIMTAAELDGYVAGFVAANWPNRPLRARADHIRQQVRSRVARGVRRLRR